MKKSTKQSVNEKYSFKNYKPSWNSVAVDYNGTHYLSKAQCMALEGIDRKTLDAYLAENTQVVIEAPDTKVETSNEITNIVND